MFVHQEEKVFALFPRMLVRTKINIFNYIKDKKNHICKKPYQMREIFLSKWLAEALTSEKNYLITFYFYFFIKNNSEGKF